MLKNNEAKIESLSDKGSITPALAAAMQGESSELANKAAASTGAAAEWAQSIDQTYKIVAFDLVESEVRVYKSRNKNEFERLSRENEVFIADGNDSDGQPLGEYVNRPIAYVAALVSGGDRSNIAVSTLQSYARNKKHIDIKGATDVLTMSAPSAGDFVAMYADELVGRTIKVVNYAEKNDRFKTKIVAFAYANEAPKAAKKLE